MAILRFPVSPSETCIVAIFKPTNFKFKILMKNYVTKNDTSGFFDKLSISFGIELELGPSRIKGFFYYISSHIISLHLDIEFGVNLMIYVGSSNHKKK
jgi:hypothetical protein